MQIRFPSVSSSPSLSLSASLLSDAADHAAAPCRRQRKSRSAHLKFQISIKDAHECRVSFSKVLTRRNEFQKLGKDLDYATGTDRHYNILGQPKESYRQCGTINALLLTSMLHIYA
ncbi:unnamed protein product [Prunus armeniaca]|uniref:Uncharacterized protein n=1 Tax=Prunus armeniaca TaxID=36596 RepID=A0A6J5WT30_PRUAR|nr:unnamed protein product [Prunus armeniaca]